MRNLSTRIMLNSENISLLLVPVMDIQKMNTVEFEEKQLQKWDVYSQDIENLCFAKALMFQSGGVV